MKILYRTLIVFFSSITLAKAQMNYSFTATTNTYTSITGTVPFLSGNENDPFADEGFATNIPIGFSFGYNSSNTYTEVSISTNGFISFGTLNDSYITNNLATGVTGQRPIVAPLWDDINLQSTNNIKYTTTGSAPNRVFIVEWVNARWGFGASAACISFQVKLYETSNWIEFAYKQETGTPVSPSASVGLTAIGTGNNNFISLSNLTAAPSVSTTTEVTTIATKPATNQSYIFKPGTLPVSISNFSVAREKNNHLIQWQTTSEISNAYFDVERSANGIQFSSIGKLNAKSVQGNSNTNLLYNITDNRPLTGINYYRLKQVDKDGKSMYSSVISIKNTSANIGSISLYPNPVKSKLNIQLNDFDAADITVSIFNVYGQQMMQVKSTNSGLIVLDVAHLVTGIYTVKISNAKSNGFLMERFVK